MDYRKHYHLLVEKALTRDKPIGYTENHHILPKCMGGSDEPKNLVILTAREHFVAHWLLHRMHPNHSGLSYAFTAICIWASSKNSRYTPSSRAVEEAKKARSTHISRKMRENNPMKSPEMRELQRQRNLGKNNFYHSLSVESKEKHREATRLSKLGGLNPNSVKVKYTPSGAIYGSIAECRRKEGLKETRATLERKGIIVRI